MTHVLRDYQGIACGCIETAWEINQSTAAVLPTGCGKTQIFAEMIRRRLGEGRAMVIAHRSELIYQAHHRIEQVCGVTCEIEMAAQRASDSLYHSMPVVVATIQTLQSKKRLERFSPMDFATLIIDEFHHATAKSYRKILDYFKVNKDLKILGVTATPDRADEEALGQVCESVAYHYELHEAIGDGWLVPIEQKYVAIAGLDFSGIRTTDKDLNGQDLAAIMESEKTLQGQCAATLEIIGDRQAIFFAASVKHAQMACDIFNRHRNGIADFVCGDTEEEARRKTIKDVMLGRTQILCNVGVATEGFDAPKIECVVMARPTKSRSLYTQMAGRGTRPLPGVVDGPITPETRKEAIESSAKKTCLLIDFVGNSGRHKLISGLDILGGKYSEEEIALAHEILEKKGGRIDQALRESQEELIERQRKEAEDRRKREEARKARLVATVKFSSHSVDPFDMWGVKPSASDWNPDGRAISEKQREMLRNNGFDPDSLNYRTAKNVLNEMFRRKDENVCTPKMEKWLARNGYDVTTPRDQAKTIMDAWKANDWHRPENDGHVAPKPIESETEKSRFAEMRQAIAIPPEPVTAVQEEWF